MEQSASLLPFPRAADGVELRHLRAFVAVAEELSFSRAAERLYLSQPALSRQISRLEQLVGCELLRRSTHRVELTLAGESLLARARPILSDVDEAVSTALAVGGELLARVARLWQPLSSLAIAGDDLEAARAEVEAMQAHFAPPKGIVIRQVTAGGVSSLVAASATDTTPSILFLHGGGFVLGSAFGYRAHAGALAAAASTGVLVPDYRLAPEHPFPAALDDALRAYLWLLDRGVDAGSVAVVGDSSGASLALSLLLRLKRDELPQPGAAALFCPLLDLKMTPDRPASAGPFNVDDLRRCVQMYLAGHPTDDPVISPLDADLRGLPPLLIQEGNGAAHHADAKALARHAERHAVSVTLEIFPVDAHDFHLFWSFLPEGADAFERAGAFIRRQAARRR